MFPGDSFSLILFLLLLQHQLDEELLQLLVTVVDAELFKAARRVNVTDSHTVKYSTQRRRCCRVFLHRWNICCHSNLLFWKISKP